MELRELLEKRNRAVAAARAIIDKADGEGRLKTDDENRQADAHIKEAQDLKAEYDRRFALQEEERKEAEAALAKSEEERKSPSAGNVETRAKAWRHLLTLDVANGEQLTTDEYRSLTSGNETAAGFLNAPQEFVKNLIINIKDQVFIRGMAKTFQTTNANGIGFPTLATDVSDTSWTTEIGAFPEDTSLKFGKRELKPHLCKKLIKVSDKLLRSDGMDPEAILMDRAAYKFGITEEKAFLTGTGNQQPLGLFTVSDQGLNTDRDVATGSITGFTGDGLKTVKYSLKAQYMKTAQWLFHRDGVALLAKLKDGNGRYLFETAEQVGAMDVLLGRPLVMSEYVPNTFTTGLYVGMFADFSHYWIVDSLALRVKRLNELYAATSEVGFIFDKETDGAPTLPEAFVRIKTS